MAGTTTEQPVAFPVWKTVTVGNLTPSTYRRQLKAVNITISDSASKMLGRSRMRFEETKTTLNLVRLSIQELGLSMPTTAEMYRAAARHNLTLCPPEVALQLWLQYPDLDLYEKSLVIAMDPILHTIADPGNVYPVPRRHSLFVISKKEGNTRYIWSLSAFSEFGWSNDQHFAFVRNK